jgi:hypothetical protein
MLTETKNGKDKWAPFCSIIFTGGSKVKFHNFSNSPVDTNDLATKPVKQVPVAHNGIKTV